MLNMAEGVARLGALATHRDVERDATVARVLPVVAETFGVVANVRVRNAATVGGVMAEADYASDPPAIFLGLDAVVAQAKVGFGKADTVPAVLQTPWLVTVPRGMQLQTAVEIKPGLEAPIAKGTVVGKVVATSNGKTVSETSLVAQADVERSGWLLRSWQHLMRLFGK